MQYTYRTSGTCSRVINFDVTDGKVHDVSFIGGCDGNLKAIGKLVEGHDATEVIKLLKGNTCGYKNTSCGDQLALALEAALAQQAQ
ncbi:MAG: TIGR03905 family TSCPD domain-containing protein [Firmicutes bacterium]|nr:TIGR03905 family TSCPD domain-containing protein [Bacillota bacterium]MBQ1476297.1 TIGR03905 family TSCPD domain-containing protein [Bacillota bacterium]MBQ1580637.1 TIGR03905 family TSCPD domain-containing protein [Bacillota bacterium]MBQ2084389.1 TIGR03905 family TSCPD domain-containing protein [Bacillota bacterium]MBQ4003885.1 TIGR03905 family TSCPD domain-containing protein [Bacillota bacterium]